MSRFKPNPHCVSTRIAQHVPTVSLTDHIAEITAGSALHYMDPEAYFMWLEDMLVAESETKELYWF